LFFSFGITIKFCCPRISSRGVTNITQIIATAEQEENKGFQTTTWHQPEAMKRCYPSEL